MLVRGLTGISIGEQGEACGGNGMYMRASQAEVIENFLESRHTFRWVVAKPRTDYKQDYLSLIIQWIVRTCSRQKFYRVCL